jgi:hypothetical protein
MQQGERKTPCFCLEKFGISLCERNWRFNFQLASWQRGASDGSGGLQIMFEHLFLDFRGAAVQLSTLDAHHASYRIHQNRL